VQKAKQLKASFEYCFDLITTWTSHNQKNKSARKDAETQRLRKEEQKRYSSKPKTILRFLLIFLSVLDKAAHY